MQGVSQTGLTNRGFKASAAVNRSTTSIALIPECGRGISRPIKQPKDVRVCLVSIFKMRLNEVA